MTTIANKVASVLVGRVYFSLSCPSEHHEKTDSSQKTASSSTQETSNSDRKRTTFDAALNRQESSSFSLETWCGFYFIAEEKEGQNPLWVKNFNLLHRPIPMVVPLDVLPVVSDAARTESQVHIHRYGIVRHNVHPDNRKDRSSRSHKRQRLAKHEETTSCEPDGDREEVVSYQYFIEIHANGIDLGEEEFERKSGGTRNEEQSRLHLRPFVPKSQAAGENGNAPLSLEDFARLEVHGQTIEQSAAQQMKKQQPPAKLNQCRFSVWATIDAISPILPVNTDPFALLELYQPQEESLEESISASHVLTCVAVMNGDALLRHSFLQPGQRIALRNVRVRKCMSFQ